MNDIESIFDSDNSGINIYDTLLKMIMYADDTVIFSSTKEGLQEALNNLSVYCEKWDISVNVRKTKIVVFRKKQKLSDQFVWRYRNQEIEVVPSFKYLGLLFANNGSFSSNSNEAINSARRALFELKKMFAQNEEMTPKIQLDLFHSMVLPILMYGCEIWGFIRADPIERFYLSFLKSILGVKKSTPNCFVYGELGVLPLIIERKMRIFKYWLKILKSENNSYIKKIYLDMIISDEANPVQSSWVNQLKHSLFELGFGYVWINQHVHCETSFLSQIKQRMSDAYFQQWNAEKLATTSSKLFKHIKNSFKFENYLLITNKSLRTALTKIRLSSHSFMIERGRWARQKIEVKDRKCTLCDVVEDEYHCLIECPRFCKERKGCLPENLLKKPSMYAFVSFMKCDDMKTCEKMGLLCFKIMKEYEKTYLCA